MSGATEVVLLGTGGGDGVPNAFCRCDSCEAARAAGVVRSPTSVLVDGRILLDLGPHVEASAARAGTHLADLAAVLVTHVHEDHCAPAALLHRTWATDEPLVVHGPPAVVAACAPWLDPAGSPITLREVTAGDDLEVAGYRVRVLPATHEAFGPAVLYDVTTPTGARLLYATDTGPLTPEALAAIHGARFDLVLLAETFGHRPADPGHHDLASFGATVADLRDIGALPDDGRVVAIHLSHHTPPPAQLAEALAAHDAIAPPDGTRLTVPGRPDRATTSDGPTTA